MKEAQYYSQHHTNSGSEEKFPNINQINIPVKRVEETEGKNKRREKPNIC